MELYQLEQFRVAAQLSHITKASQVLSISQPALSKNIRNLEKELGYPLFDHVGKNIELNNNGRILLDCVNEIFCSIDNVRRRLETENGSPNATVSICVKAASKLIPEILQDYSKKHPGTRFSIFQTQNPQSDNHQYDFTIDAALGPASDSHSLTLLKEEIRLALPVDHRLAKASHISLSELKNEPFISLQKGMGLANITDYYCQLSGFIPNIVFESDNPSTLRSLIQLGMGVAFIPLRTWPGLADNSIRLLPIHPIQCSRYINLHWMPKRYLSPTALDFKKYLIQYFSEMEH